MKQSPAPKHNQSKTNVELPLSYSGKLVEQTCEQLGADVNRSHYAVLQTL